ncbi:MAG: ABC transporter ATP-binding protein [Verrucomicrobia bacterium]|nr:ABC transporter ATP-binding protein [Verrucomicrobiota bacterium]
MNTHLTRFRDALALVWTAARNWTLAWFALLLFQGLLPAATVFLTKRVVDGLVAAIKTGENVGPLLVSAGLMAVVLLLAQLLSGAVSWIRAMQAELLSEHVHNLIHEKAIAADLASFESPDFYDHLHRARAEAGYRPLALLENAGGLLQNSITLLAMGALLARFGVWLPVILLVSAAPALLVVLRQNRRRHRWQLEATADERRSWYYDWLLTARESAGEIRLFGLGDYFRSAFQAVRSRLRAGRLVLIKNESLSSLCAGVMALAVTGGALGWMAWRAFHGWATLGDVALLYQAFNQGQQLVRTLLQNAGQVYANTLFLGNLFDFLALKPTVVAASSSKPAPTGLRGQIQFHNVTFRYPGADAPALREFNLTLPAGQIVAIVGRNGSGKSTLVKLLCRFYDPTDGRIEWDGTDLRAFQPVELRRQISALFQEAVRYNATVAQNISFETADVEAAAVAAGADGIAQRLGYGQLLGKWFEGGVELSAGEWQRLALARAFARNAPLVLLDEATSAMDSWAEAEWLRRLRAVAAGRTVVIISHRFTTAMQADVIHVMEQGRIVESGTHAQLVKRGGQYAQSWEAQSRG